VDPAGPGRVARDAAVPLPNGGDSEPLDGPALGAPERDNWPPRPGYYLLAAGVLTVLALLLLRRRRPAAAAGVAPAPTSAPAPAPALAPDLDADPDPVPDNVSRLPTNLNAIYELGRLDERLEQERSRKS